MALILILLPLFMRERKFALVSLLGVFLAVLTVGAIGSAGVVVAYSGTTPITDTSGLPTTATIFIIISGLIITIAKGLDVV